MGRATIQSSCERRAAVSRFMTRTHKPGQPSKSSMLTQCSPGRSACIPGFSGGHVCRAVCRASDRTGLLPRVMAHTAMR